jgi:hypothetical protein
MQLHRVRVQGSRELSTIFQLYGHVVVSFIDGGCNFINSETYLN